MSSRAPDAWGQPNSWRATAGFMRARKQFRHANNVEEAAALTSQFGTESAVKLALCRGRMEVWIGQERRKRERRKQERQGQEWQGQERRQAERRRRLLPPTTTGFPARRAVAALRKHDIDPAPLLQRVGLSEQDLDNQENRISSAAQARLLEFAADALHDPSLGFRLATEADPRELGLVFYLASAAKDLGEAIALLVRYCRIVNEAIHRPECSPDKCNPSPHAQLGLPGV